MLFIVLIIVYTSLFLFISTKLTVTMCHNIQNMLEEARENSSSDLSHIHIALVPRQEEYDIT